MTYLLDTIHSEFAHPFPCSMQQIPLTSLIPLAHDSESSMFVPARASYGPCRVCRTFTTTLCPRCSINYCSDTCLLKSQAKLPFALQHQCDWDCSAKHASKTSKASRVILDVDREGSVLSFWCKQGIMRSLLFRFSYAEIYLIPKKIETAWVFVDEPLERNHIKGERTQYKPSENNS